MQPRVDDAEALYANVEMSNWREADVIPEQVLRGRWTLSQPSMGERQEYQLETCVIYSNALGVSNLPDVH